MIKLSKAELADVVEALGQAADYFDNRADADGDSQGYWPNDEMKLQVLCERALEVLAQHESIYNDGEPRL